MIWVQYTCVQNAVFNFFYLVLFKNRKCYLLGGAPNLWTLLSCIFRFDKSLKAQLQPWTEHLYGLVRTWTFISCLAKWCDQPKRLPETNFKFGKLTYTFQSEWYKFQKNLPHFSQMYFFSSGVIWLIIWYSNLTLEGNNFSQCGHGSSCEWTLSLWEANPIVPLKNGGKNIFSIYIIFFSKINAKVIHFNVSSTNLENKHCKFYIWFAYDEHHDVFSIYVHLAEIFHKYHNNFHHLSRICHEIWPHVQLKLRIKTNT